MRTGKGGYKSPSPKKSIRSTGTVAQVSTETRPVRRSNAWRFYGEFKPLEPLDAGVRRTVARGRGRPTVGK